MSKFHAVTPLLQGSKASGLISSPSRAFSTPSSRRSTSGPPSSVPTKPAPALSAAAAASPPRLPPTEQAEFERLQRAAAAGGVPLSAMAPGRPAGGAATETQAAPLRAGAPAEFDGNVNPTTGEVGGPKTDPLKWGGEKDWSYAGRVTDF